MGERFYERFPSITAACREIGIDPARERIPVAPAAHYACGGVPARLDGTTALPGLYAVGEVACTGVHGANRLASNSLTEGVVSGTRLGRDLAWELPDAASSRLPTMPAAAAVARRRRSGARSAPTMSRHVGVLRDAGVAADARPTCSTRSPARSTAGGRRRGGRGRRRTCSPWRRPSSPRRGRATESRGCHRRTDFPEPRDEWRRHLDVHARRPTATHGLSR